jgi:hypothetical protein
MSIACLCSSTTAGEPLAPSRREAACATVEEVRRFIVCVVESTTTVDVRDPALLTGRVRRLVLRRTPPSAERALLLDERYSPSPDSASDARVDGDRRGYLADVRAMFWAYLIGIAAGLGFFIVIGLAHH